MLAYSYARKLTLGALVAVVTDSLIFAIGNATDATWEAGQPYPIGYGMVVGASILPLIIGGFVVKFLEKKKEVWRNRLATAGLVFAVLGAPMGYLGGKDVPTGLSLGSMHIVVGLVWFLATRKK